MDESKNAKISVPAVVVLYDFQYTAKDKREISMRKGEKLYLIEKTNKDWWQVIRQSERRSFYVPAQYVEVISKEKLPLDHLNLLPESRVKEKVEYENLNVKHRDNIALNKHNSSVDSNNRLENEMVKLAQYNRQKPVPKTRTKVSTEKINYVDSTALKTEEINAMSESEKCGRPKYGEKRESGLNQQKSLDRFAHTPELRADCDKTGYSARGKNLSKTRTKISGTINESDQFDSKNRMRSSYNLRVKPSKSFDIHQKSPGKLAKESVALFKSDNSSLSRSLEKLAQEIKFQPKEIDPNQKPVPTLTHHLGLDDACGKPKTKIKENSSLNSNNEKMERLQKSEERSLQPQSKGSVFTRLRRSLHHSSSFKSNNFKKLSKNDSKACELSLSWEGGLDKALELEMSKKPQVTPTGLQRSRTFMVAERSPTIFRHPSSIYQGRNRVDIAYHSQKRPEMKNVLSTFKPISKIEEVNRKPSKNSSEDTKTLEVVDRGKEEGVIPEKGKLEKDTERFSHSESEDDPKCFPGIQKKSRIRSSIDSNLTHSEGTELSESDENGSLGLERTRVREPLNKRRTSLMRNRRVSTAKSRTVTARQLPPTPTPEDRSTKDLGNGWGVYIFDEKRNYYYNRITGEKSWKPPRKHLSSQDNRYVGSRESICSDTSGSIIRSSTSSPSNDRVQSNSLNRSNVSLSSRSTGCDNSGFDLTKSSSGCNLREEVTRNRSSLTSSPATGQSRSSSYSVIKSSRDSLNRCSPIENIPYEDDDLELRDHVYQKGVTEEHSEAASEEELKPRMHDGREDLLDNDDGGGDEEDDDIDEGGRPATGVPVPPGWTECYDDTTSQFYYIHKDTKQKDTHYYYTMMDLKLTLCSRKFDNIIPVNISIWLKEIRENVEHYEEEDAVRCSLSSDLNVSSLSVYDNVCEEEEEEEEEVTVMAEAKEPTEELQLRRHRLETITEEEEEEERSLTWPLRLCVRSPDTRSVKNVLQYVLSRTEPKLWFHLKDDNHRIICFNWLNSKLTIIKRVLNVNDAITVGKDIEELRWQEGEEPVTNLLATCDGKANEERSWSLLNGIRQHDYHFETRSMCCKWTGHETNKYSDEELFRELLDKIDSDISELEQRMTAFEQKSNSLNSDRNLRHSHSLPPDLYLKPPLPPWRRKTKAISRSKNFNRRNRPLRRQQFVTLLHVLHAIDESNSRKQREEITKSGDELEYEPQELLMLQRVTDSTKERRKLCNERKASELENAKRMEILKVLDDELKNIAGERSIKIREDVIIDWENDYDNLSEPVVLEGKSVKKRSGVEENSVMSAGVPICRSAETEIAEKEVADRAAVCCEDCHTSDKISVSSMSDYEDTLTTYSDIESDLIEAIHLGESWCNEVCLDQETDASDRENFRQQESITVKYNALTRKSQSCSDFTNAVKPLTRWKSLDYFRDSLAEKRRVGRVASTVSIASDVTEWLARMRGVIYVEDMLLSSDDKEEWFTSFDPEGRLYFFDEQSNESSWALPVITTDGDASKYIIQRSATESTITKSSEATEDGDKRRGRISSTRSNKTQSMVIEAKMDFPGKDDGKTLSMPRDLTKIYGEILRSGMLNKTKICENGKKLRKNWTPAFVVLSNAKLMFFKDAKTFHSMKPGNDYMCLSLQGAVIEKGDKISSKKNVYRINSPDQTEILIQTDRTTDAEEWFKDISNVIQSLPQESIDSSTSSLDPSSPSKVGRTKSVKARSKDGGSMEDLSLNPEERQNKIKAKLKKFFNRRPTVDSLKKKGIWKDEPVFGCSLEQITKNRTPRVPVFVEKCIECIESKEENLKTDGLYRASGNLSQVQKIRLEVDQNNLSILKEEEDVHVLTGSLKLFFRELKDPLIPFKQLVPALTAINNPKRKEKIKEYRKIVGSLPGPNYDTLKFLLLHLLKVEKYNEFNRMNVNNLAIVFGPTLMWPEQESTNMALDFMQQNLVIECLLREFQEIFT